MNSTPMIIMAAGVSSRMKKSSITKNMTKKQINQSNSRVKGYIQVAEGKEPFIFYLIKNSINAGVKEFYIIVSEKSQEFQEYLKSLENRLQISINLLEQSS